MVRPLLMCSPSYVSNSSLTLSIWIEISFGLKYVRVITDYSMICKHTLADWLLGYVSASYAPWVFDLPSFVFFSLAPLLHCLLLKQHPWSMATHKHRYRVILNLRHPTFLDRIYVFFLVHFLYRLIFHYSCFDLRDLASLMINTWLNTHVFKGNDQRISHLHGLL